MSLFLGQCICCHAFFHFKECISIPFLYVEFEKSYPQVFERQIAFIIYAIIRFIFMINFC